MPDLPYEVSKASWSKDGRSIFFLANMGVHTELFKVARTGRQAGATHQRKTRHHRVDDVRPLQYARFHVA